MIAFGLITLIIGAGFLEGTLPGIGLLLALGGLAIAGSGLILKTEGKKQ
jgi:hypothetical protein